MKQYILALDQGTSSSRAIIFDTESNIISSAQTEFTQFFPKSSWVEHDANEIWESQLKVAKEAIKKANLSPSDIKCIGITNQRETTVAWNKQTGNPICKAIVWQDKRTSDYCESLKKEGFDSIIKNKTGLVTDAYFSGTKMRWILNNVEQAQELAEKGDLLFGTVDSWLIYKLTNGKIHATDSSNASRTMLYNIYEEKWDEELLSKLNIPKNTLAEVKNSSDDFGQTEKSLFGAEIPITGVAGDQQAALFGQACFEEGMAKNTYGTGCFMLMNTGKKPFHSKNGLLTTIAWSINNETYYALEGSVFIAGAAIQWLRDGLKILDEAPDSEYFAMKTASSDGVYVVPAFSGLGAPYWDMYARGAIFGLTRGTNKNHITRATLESLAYQTKDVLDAMESDTNITLKNLRVDGGACSNNMLMQFQSDILEAPVIRPKVIETTALGAAYLAGLKVGLFSLDNITKMWQEDSVFEPQITKEEVNKLYKGWQKAVKRCMNWEKDDELD